MNKTKSMRGIPGKATVMQIFDKLSNFVSGLGTKSSAGASDMLVGTILSDIALEAYFQYNWLSRKIVTIIPDDMTKEWRTMKSIKHNDEDMREYKDYEDLFEIKGKLTEAMYWARLYGGSMILPVVDANVGYDRPFHPEFITKGSLKNFVVLDPRTIFPASAIQVDPFSAYYNKPEWYTLLGSSQRIHRSWLIPFRGNKLSSYMVRTGRRNYWDQSVLEPIFENIMHATSAGQNVSELLAQFNLDILSIKDLADSLDNCNEEEKQYIRNRFEEYAYLKSNFNLIAIDAEEQWARNEMSSMTGLAPIVEMLHTICSGASDIPVVRLMGTSAKGLSATGEGDLNNYYDNISAKQELEMKAPMSRIDLLLQLSLWGEVDESFTYEWNPLYTESAGEISTRQYQDAQRDAIYEEMGAIQVDVVASNLNATGVYQIPEKRIKVMTASVDEDIANDEFNKDDEESDDFIPGEETENEEDDANSSTEPEAKAEDKEES